MNSYNENLHISVVTSLQRQQLNQRKVASQLNASLFSLLYAQGATITANEKLETAQADLQFKTKVKQQAVMNSNLCNNILNAEIQSNQHVKQSVANAAVCASNVQLAAASVVRLAGDIGSIYSIVNAADFDTDIYTMAEQVRDLMNITAYDAEKASQLAMEASMLTAEISSSTVLDNTKSTVALMNNLLQITSADFDAASQLVNSNNTVLATATTKEKLAEGTQEDISADYKAVVAGYNATNNELNLGLTIKPVKGKENSAVDVMFNLIQNPFQATFQDATGTSKSNTKPGNDSTTDPVQNYYIILVKETKQTIFSLSDAESLLVNDNPDQCIPVVLPTTTDDTAPKAVLPRYDIVQTIHVFSPTPAPDNPDDTDDIMDSDGDPITLGTGYVVFIMAVFKEGYKKFLNEFDNYLSAPSASFFLADTLPKATSLHAEGNTIFFWAPATNKMDIKQLPVEYRCLFLPNGKQVPPGLLTNDALQDLNKEISSLESIANEYDPRIVAAEAELATLLAKQKTLQAENQNNKSSEQSDQVAQLDKSISAISKQLKDLNQEKSDAINLISDNVNTKTLPFFFNLTLAENVPASNYYVTRPADAQSATPPQNANDTRSPELLVYWQITCDDSTMDIFGNLLSNSGSKQQSADQPNSYLPVILSVSTAPEQNLDQYTSVLSDYNESPVFVYTQPD